MSTPALKLLLGPQAGDVMSAAVGECGAQLSALRAVDVHAQPGGGARVRYAGDIRRADGSICREVLIATTGESIPPGAAVLAGEFDGVGVQVGVWRWPQDPALPGLAIAADPARLAGLLAAHGVSTVGPLRITTRAYRPGRRAVLEVRDDEARWFVKVVRPSAIADLRARHDLICARLPVPAVLAATADGVALLSEAPGTSLRDLLSGGPSPELPTPSTLQDLLDALPGALMQLPPRLTQLQRVAHTAQVLRDTAGAFIADLSIDIDAVLDRVLTASTRPTPAVPVHGDFYEGQLLAAGGRVTGLLDVDTAGPGERADEWAMLIGHLAVLGLTQPGARGYCDAVLAHAERAVPSADLHLRTAAVVLGLATGPFRAQRPDWPAQTAARMALARHWAGR